MNKEQLRSPAEVRERLVTTCQEMARRLRGLLDAKTRVADETHALRKFGKSLRGGMTLLGVPKSARRAVGAVGKMLGAPRDSVSRSTTWHRLGLAEGPHAGESSVLAISALLGVHARSATRRPPAAAVEWEEIRLQHASTALLALAADDLEARVEAGRRHLAKQLRKRLKTVRHHPGASELHELRKALKAWIGALHHLGEDADKSLVEYADLLGDVNDLEVLGSWLEAHGFSPALAPLPWKALRTRLNRLSETILEGAPEVRRVVSAA